MTHLKKSNIARNRYYKGKSQPACSRAVDGQCDLFLQGGESGFIPMRAVIDFNRREAEDELSKVMAEDTRAMIDCDSADDELHNDPTRRQDNVRRGYHVVNSDQSRELT